jgi:hypothetical protein
MFRFRSNGMVVRCLLSWIESFLYWFAHRKSSADTRCRSTTCSDLPFCSLAARTVREPASRLSRLRSVTPRAPRAVCRINDPL